MVLGNTTGLGNEHVDGYYFDDAWEDAPGMGEGIDCAGRSAIGGPTEEDPNCAGTVQVGDANCTGTSLRFVSASTCLSY